MRTRPTLVRTIIVLLVTASLSSCVATPVPEPPDLAPPDTDLMTVQTILGVFETEVLINGSAGAGVAGTTLWIVDVDGEDPPETFDVNDDGSFDVRIFAEWYHRLRLQLRNTEGSRSPPLDLIVPESIMPVAPALATYEDCMQLDPAQELDFGHVPTGESRSASVLIRNDCDGVLTVDSLDLRAAAPAFDITTTTPLHVEVGEAREIELRFTSDPTLDDEVILLIGVTVPFEERRPMTLFGHVSTD